MGYKQQWVYYAGQVFPVVKIEVLCLYVPCVLVVIHQKCNTCIYKYVFPHRRLPTINQTKRGGGNPIHWLNPTTFLFLSQARTWISNIICCDPFCIQLRWEAIVRLVHIGGIDDHHCLNFLFNIRGTIHINTFILSLSLNLCLVVYTTT